MSAQYAMIGAAGYIAPRHMKAIKETGGQLSVAYDINDSVGIIDSHFPKATFFTEFELFSDHIYSMICKDKPIDYVSICSPNYLHKAHMAFALRSGADAICEKPLVLDPHELDDLAQLEQDTGRKVNSILQLRLHPAIIKLREKVAQSAPGKVYDVDLGYFTSRGSWYRASWKADHKKSGGIATNIGIHFYDMLGFVFGPLSSNVVHHRGDDAAAGYLEFEKARVRWVLSINQDHLPSHTALGQTTHRSITVDGEEIEFSGGFTDLHTASYQQILEKQGYGLDIVRPSIEIVHEIHRAAITPNNGERHPDLGKILAS